MSFPALLGYFYQIYTRSFCILQPLCTVVLICHSQFLSNVSISFTIHHSLSSDCLKLLYCYLSFPPSSLEDLSFFMLLLLSVIVFLPAEFLSFFVLLTPDCWTQKHKGIGITFLYGCCMLVRFVSGVFRRMCVLKFNRRF